MRMRLIVALFIASLVCSAAAVAKPIRSQRGKVVAKKEPIRAKRGRKNFSVYNKRKYRKKSKIIKRRRGNIRRVVPRAQKKSTKKPASTPVKTKKKVSKVDELRRARLLWIQDILRGQQ